MHRERLASDEWRTMLVERRLPFAFGALRPEDLGDDVLEIGPGPGLTTDLLAPRLPRLTAIELDPDLAASLAARTAGTSVEVIEGDATAMPFEDGRFSGVVTFTMLHHVPSAAEQDRVLAEARRVLRPGGLLVANDSVARADLEPFHEGDVYNPVDPATLPERLRAAGFVDVDVREDGDAWACHARRPPA